MVLEFALKTSIGQFIVTTYIDGDACFVWFEVRKHYSTSTASLHASNQLFTKLQNLDILTFPKHQDYLTQFQELIQRYDQIESNNKMTAQFKINSLHNAVPKDKILKSSWVNYQEIHTRSNPGH